MSLREREREREQNKCFKRVREKVKSRFLRGKSFGEFGVGCGE